MTKKVEYRVWGEEGQFVEARGLRAALRAAKMLLWLSFVPRSLVEVERFGGFVERRPVLSEDCVLE